MTTREVCHDGTARISGRGQRGGDRIKNEGNYSDFFERPSSRRKRASLNWLPAWSFSKAGTFFSPQGKSFGENGWHPEELRLSFSMTHGQGWTVRDKIEVLTTNYPIKASEKSGEK
jgi:hypothetical protein